jgi:hypothetical protein
MRIEVYKETTDNFHPNYKINAQAIIRNEQYVRIFLTSLFDGKFRVGVWGADDFGMDVDYSEYWEAKISFSELILSEEPISIHRLIELGFKRF